MITDVSLWRCNCGVNIKVVTETDRATINEGFKLEVACPNCGDKQLVYAHRIVQVTTEKSDEASAS
jgi:ribosomal protein S27E